MEGAGGVEGVGGVEGAGGVEYYSQTIAIIKCTTIKNCICTVSQGCVLYNKNLNLEVCLKEWRGRDPPEWSDVFKFVKEQLEIVEESGGGV